MNHFLRIPISKVGKTIGDVWEYKRNVFLDHELHIFGEFTEIICFHFVSHSQIPASTSHRCTYVSNVEYTMRKFNHFFLYSHTPQQSLHICNSILEMNEWGLWTARKVHPISNQLQPITFTVTHGIEFIIIQVYCNSRIVKSNWTVVWRWIIFS